MRVASGFGLRFAAVISRRYSASADHERSSVQQDACPAWIRNDPVLLQGCVHFSASPLLSKLLARGLHAFASDLALPAASELADRCHEAPPKIVPLSRRMPPLPRQGHPLKLFQKFNVYGLRRCRDRRRCHLCRDDAERSTPPGAIWFSVTDLCRTRLDTFLRAQLPVEILMKSMSSGERFAERVLSNLGSTFSASSRNFALDGRIRLRSPAPPNG